MDELIARLVANVGVDKVAAEKSVGIILDFLVKEGPPDKVQTLIDKMPGAQALLQAQQANDAGGGGFSMGGLMGAGTKMMARRAEHGSGAGRHQGRQSPMPAKKPAKTRSERSSARFRA